MWLSSNPAAEIQQERRAALGATGASLHLSVKLLDRAPARGWRDFQRIKKELVWLKHEALEIYPAESRKVDTATSSNSARCR